MFCLGSTVVHVHKYAIGVIAMSMGGEGLKQWWTGPLFEGDDAAIQAEVDWVTSVFGILDLFHTKTHRIHGDAHLENFVKCNVGTDEEKPIIVDLGRSKLLEELPIEDTMFGSMKLIDLLHLLKRFYTSPRHLSGNEKINKWIKLHEALHKKFAILFKLYLESMEASVLLIRKCTELFSSMNVVSDDRTRVHDGGSGNANPRVHDGGSGNANPRVHDGGSGNAYQSRFNLSDLFVEDSPMKSINAKEEDPTTIYMSVLHERDKMLERIIHGKWFKITRNGKCDVSIKERDECTFLEICCN